VWCYWEHLGEHLDGNPLGTQWQHIGAKDKKEKKCDAIGNILENTLMGTPWELNGNTLEHERNKRKKKVGCYWEHLGEHIDGNSMATHWSKKKEKKKKV